MFLQPQLIVLCEGFVFSLFPFSSLPAKNIKNISPKANKLSFDFPISNFARLIAISNSHLLSSDSPTIVSNTNSTLRPGTCFFVFPYGSIP